MLNICSNKIRFFWVWGGAGAKGQHLIKFPPTFLFQRHFFLLIMLYISYQRLMIHLPLFQIDLDYKNQKNKDKEKLDCTWNLNILIVLDSGSYTGRSCILILHELWTASSGHRDRQLKRRRMSSGMPFTLNSGVYQYVTTSMMFLKFLNFSFFAINPCRIFILLFQHLSQ